MIYVSSGEGFSLKQVGDEPGCIVGNYTLDILVGKGGFGKVFRGTHIETNEIAAIKFISKRSIRDLEDSDRLFTEVQALRDLKHPNIITIHDVLDLPSYFCLFMEFASHGELREFVKERHRLSEPAARWYILQIMKGVLFCHQRGIVHRDLKLENILLDSELNCKIVDFGLSSFVPRDGSVATEAGTKSYFAPEVIQRQTNEFSSFLLDVWAIGIILYAMTQGTLPFSVADAHGISLLKNKSLPFIPESSPGLKSLIYQLLEPNAGKRMMLAEQMSHSWLKGCCNSGDVQILVANAHHHNNNSNNNINKNNESVDKINLENQDLVFHVRSPSSSHLENQSSRIKTFGGGGGGGENVLQDNQNKISFEQRKTNSQNYNHSLTSEGNDESGIYTEKASKYNALSPKINDISYNEDHFNNNNNIIGDSGSDAPRTTYSSFNPHVGTENTFLHHQHSATHSNSSNSNNGINNNSLDSHSLIHYQISNNSQHARPNTRTVRYQDDGNLVNNGNGYSPFSKLDYLPDEADYDDNASPPYFSSVRPKTTPSRYSVRHSTPSDFNFVNSTLTTTSPSHRQNVSLIKGSTTNNGKQNRAQPSSLTTSRFGLQPSLSVNNGGDAGQSVPRYMQSTASQRASVAATEAARRSAAIGGQGGGRSTMLDHRGSVLGVASLSAAASTSVSPMGQKGRLSSVGGRIINSGASTPARKSIGALDTLDETGQYAKSERHRRQTITGHLGEF